MVRTSILPKSNVIYQLPAVSEVAVTAADDRWGEVIVRKPGQPLAEEEVLKHCAGAGKVQPRRYVL